MLKEAMLNQKFLHDGYVILRGVVPADRLESLRNAYEMVVARARKRDPTWYTTATARTNVVPYLDKDTVETLEFALHENTFDVSARVLGRESEKVALVSVSVLCNPEFEPTETLLGGQPWGTDPRNWHRDIRPDQTALRALLIDEQANGPGYAQWNIALYDDSILYLIPGSHRRLASEAESMQLQADGGTQAPLPNCICAELTPGDGVVYNNLLLHWGSKYSQRQKRRTIHLGYRAFGSFFSFHWGSSVPQCVSKLFPSDAPQRSTLERGSALFRDENTRLRKVFRAVIANDAAQFQADLAHLHPRSEGRLACMILLSKIARDVHRLSQRSGNEKHANSDALVEDADVEQQMASNFTAAEVEKLWERFGVVDKMVRSGDPSHLSGFLGPSTDYFFEELPLGMTANGVISAMFGQSQ